MKGSGERKMITLIVETNQSGLIRDAFYEKPWRCDGALFYLSKFTKDSIIYIDRAYFQTLPQMKNRTFIVVVESKVEQKELKTLKNEDPSQFNNEFEIITREELVKFLEENRNKTFRQKYILLGYEEMYYSAMNLVPRITLIKTDQVNREGYLVDLREILKNYKVVTEHTLAPIFRSPYSLQEDIGYNLTTYTQIL